MSLNTGDDWVALAIILAEINLMPEFIMVPLEPLLGLESADSSIIRNLNVIIWVLRRFKGVVIIGAPAAVQERGHDCNDWFTVSTDMACNLHDLALVRVRDKEDARFSRGNISNRSPLLSPVLPCHECFPF